MRSQPFRLRGRFRRVRRPANGVPTTVLPAILVPALLACAAPTLAQDKAAAPPITLTIKPPPVPTVPVPPPEPPTRPDALHTLFPAGDIPPKPILDAPVPPERPPELTAPAQTAGQAEPAPDTAPAAPAPSTPLPPARPDELRTLFPAGDAPPKPILDAPAPPDRPAELSPRTPMPTPSSPGLDTPSPPERPSELSGEAGRKLTLDTPEDTACLGRLAELGVDFEKRAAIVNGQCSVAHPLAVSGAGGGVILRPDAIMVCRVTEALARWRVEVQAIAKAELDDSLEGLTSAGAYVCRGQNNVSEAQLSDHAFADAIDIAGFTFANRKPIHVGMLPEGSKEAAFLAAVRAKACSFFTTVLGPGTNEAHATHLHFDTRERHNGYRLCE